MAKRVAVIALSAVPLASAIGLQQRATQGGLAGGGLDTWSLDVNSSAYKSFHALSDFIVAGLKQKESADVIYAGKGLDAAEKAKLHEYSALLKQPWSSPAFDAKDQLPSELDNVLAMAMLNSAHRVQQLPALELYDAGSSISIGDPGLDIQGADPVVLMELMQEMVSYLKHDEFMKSFLILNDAYQTSANKLQQFGRTSGLNFDATAANASSAKLIGMVGKFLQAGKEQSTKFILELADKCGEFAESMPTKSLKDGIKKHLQPLIENITNVINLDTDDISKIFVEGTNQTYFCEKIRPLVSGARKGQKELDKISRQVNMSTRMIPTIGRMIQNMLPVDDPDTDNIPPRIMLLAQALINTSSIAIGAMLESVRDYDKFVFHKIDEVVKCEGSGAPRGHGAGFTFGLVLVTYAAMRAAFA